MCVSGSLAMAWFSFSCAYLPWFLFLFLSVCAVVALCQDVVYRYPATDLRGRQVSEIGAALHYPSYLDSGPDYEAEMRYYHGDTLSPKDKVNHIKWYIIAVVVLLSPKDDVDHITYGLPWW